MTQNLFATAKFLVESDGVDLDRCSFPGLPHSVATCDKKRQTPSIMCFYLTSEAAAARWKCSITCRWKWLYVRCRRFAASLIAKLYGKWQHCLTSRVTEPQTDWNDFRWHWFSAAVACFGQLRTRCWSGRCDLVQGLSSFLNIIRVTLVCSSM